MRAGETHYTALDGTPALKRAIQEKFSRDNGIEVAPSEILVAPGAKMLLFLAFLATLNPDDEVIIPAPYWTSYPEIVAIMGGRPVILPTRAADGFRLEPEDLARAITSRTRWVLLNSPSNPAGGCTRRRITHRCWRCWRTIPRCG